MFIAACQTIVDTKGEVLASFLPNYVHKTNINLDPLREAAEHLSHLLHYFCLSRSFLQGPSPKGFYNINQMRLFLDRGEEEFIGFPKKHGWLFGTVESPPKEKGGPLRDFEFDGGAEEIFDSFHLYEKFLDGPHGKYIYAKEEILGTHLLMVKRILHREALFLSFHEMTSQGRFSEALPDAELLVKHFSDEEGSFVRLLYVCLCLEDLKRAAEVCQSFVTRFFLSIDLEDVFVGMERNDAHGLFRYREIYFCPSTFRKFLVESVNENWERKRPLKECLIEINLPPRIIGDSALEETVLIRGWKEFSKRREGKKVIGVISSPSIIVPKIGWCPGVGPFILTIFRDEEGCEVLLMLDNFPGVSQYVFIIFNFLYLRTIFSYLLPSYHKKYHRKTTPFEATKKILPIGTKITIKEPFLTQFPVPDRAIPLFSIYTNNPSDIDVHPSSSSSPFPSFISSFCLGCGKKGGEGRERLKGCRKCRIGGFYCSKSCQKSDWKLHKKHH